jgi:hypothetical protein
MFRPAVFALLLVIPAGCGRKDRPVPGVEFGGTRPTPAESRMKESLDAIESRIAKQEEALRRARGAKLTVAQRFDMVEAWLDESEEIQKQLDEVIALGRRAAEFGAVGRPRAEQVQAVAERFDRLGRDWDAVFTAAGGELRKREKPGPPKK